MTALGKWKLGVYVLAIFLAGGGSGAFIAWQVCRRTPVALVPPTEIGARLRARFQSQLALTPEQVENNIQNRIPLHREGKPEDVAEAITMLVTDDFVTGETIAVDGGMAMRIV